MSKHTPGPWIIYAEKNGAVRVDAAEKVVANANGGTPECLANARLIAAAPEMLELLKALRDSVTYNRMQFPEIILRGDKFKSVFSLIDKAEGV